MVLRHGLTGLGEPAKGRSGVTGVKGVMGPLDGELFLGLVRRGDTWPGFPEASDRSALLVWPAVAGPAERPRSGEVSFVGVGLAAPFVPRVGVWRFVPSRLAPSLAGGKGCSTDTAAAPRPAAGGGAEAGKYSFAPPPTWTFAVTTIVCLESASHSKEDPPAQALSS